MPGSAKFSRGISIRKPAVLSGWTTPKTCRGIHAKKFKLTTTCRASDFFRTSGCVVVQCDAGCRKVTPIGRSTRLKPAAARACRSRASISTTFVSTTKHSATHCLRSSSHAVLTGSRLGQVVHVVCVWRSNISRSIAVGSVLWSISTRAGSSS